MATEPDRWSRWVLSWRHGGNPRQRDASDAHLVPVRDRVLAGAQPLEGATLLDVGTGDGLIGLEALDLVGERGAVIFSDVSLALLEQCRESVRSRGLLDRARFVLTRAEELAEIPDRSVDVITTRSVLIFVADKPRAFAAMRRVLRPGGRISLFEPINRLTFPEPGDRFWGYDVTDVRPLAEKVKDAFLELQDPAAQSMLDFDDRDLVRFAEDAGFREIHLGRHIAVQPAGIGEPGSVLHPLDLATFLDIAPNPLAPTVGETIDHALDGAERERFLAHLRCALTERRAVRRTAVAYLTAA
jgi:arsenite methyltransferase